MDCGVVNGSKAAPAGTNSVYSKYYISKNCTLAIIVLSIYPFLLYLLYLMFLLIQLQLFTQFQKKMWANKLALRQCLYLLQAKEGQIVHEHVKTLTEIFNELSVLLYFGDNIDDKDKVVYLLASLPDSYEMLVTALEANTEVQNMETVIE